MIKDAIMSSVYLYYNKTFTGEVLIKSITALSEILYSGKQIKRYSPALMAEQHHSGAIFWIALRNRAAVHWISVTNDHSFPSSDTSPKFFSVMRCQ
jgi:hypothetical protein